MQADVNPQTRGGLGVFRVIGLPVKGSLKGSTGVSLRIPCSVKG